MLLEDAQRTSSLNKITMMKRGFWMSKVIDLLTVVTRIFSDINLFQHRAGRRDCRAPQTIPENKATTQYLH